MSDQIKYKWLFTVKDVMTFSGCRIAVTADTYRDALSKIRGLELPELRRYADIEDGLKLSVVSELALDDDDLILEAEAEDED